MKTHLLLAAAIMTSASGCSSIKFDSLQYDRFITVYETSSKLQKQCNQPDVIRAEIDVLQNQTDHIASYAAFRSNSPEVATSTAAVTSMVSELSKKYQDDNNPSFQYCMEKLSNITSGTKTIISTLGAQQ